MLNVQILSFYFWSFLFVLDLVIVILNLFIGILNLTAYSWTKFTPIPTKFTPSNSQQIPFLYNNLSFAERFHDTTFSFIDFHFTISVPGGDLPGRNVSIVIIIPLLQRGQVSGLKLRCSRQICFRFFFSLTGGTKTQNACCNRINRFRLEEESKP